MNIKKKAASLAFTATLLASLIATVAAPLATAATAVAGVGVVPRGGTSATAASFTFTENSVACFAGGGSATALIVEIDDVDLGDDVHFVSPVTVSGPGSLGATANITSGGGGTNNRITIGFAASSLFNQEQVTVTARIAADGGATSGAIQATLTGTEAGCVLPGTGTATGSLVDGIPGAAASAAEPISLTGNCSFAVTGGSNGTATFSDSADPRSVTPAVGGVVDDGDGKTPDPGDTQAVDFGAGLVGHGAGFTVTQTVSFSNCRSLIGSPGSIGDALTQDTDTPLVVNAGETNQPAAQSHWDESPNGSGDEFAGSIVFSIITPAAGVVFSTAPGVDPDAGLDLGGGSGTEVLCSLSVDRRSCSVTVVANAGGTTEELDLEDILLDVAGTVPAGTPVMVALVQTPAIPIIVNSNTIAFVGRVISAVSAQPPIYIGENDQESGMKILTEAAPGFFQSGVGSNNTFAICITTGETFTRAPWAVVTQGTLLLLSGFVGAPQVRMTLYNGGNCAFANVFSGSTGVTPSRIEIRGSADNVSPLATGPNNGPRLSVPNLLAPGSEQAGLFIGDQAVILTGCSTPTSCAADPGFAGFLSEAIRAFRNNGVTVTAATQPRCAAGTPDCLAGNIVLQELVNGRFKPTDVIVVRVLPPANTQRLPALFKSGTTNDLPVITTNAASGLLVGAVTVFCPPNALLGLVFCTFAFPVTQQSFGPALGTITISNQHLAVVSDAPAGPVLFQVTNSSLVGGTPTSQVFDTVVSPLTIGTEPTRTAINNASASGVHAAFDGTVYTSATKIVPAGTNVTFRCRMSPSAAGERVQIQMAIGPAGGSFGPFLNVTARAVNNQGDAFFSWKTSDNTAPYSAATPGKISVRCYFAGNTVHGPAFSLARQALFT